MQRRVDEAKSLVEVDGIYYHYKSPDKYYVVESVGLLEGSEEVCVIYRALYDKGLVWVRPLDDFCSEVEKDGEVMERFSRIS